MTKVDAVMRAFERLGGTAPQHLQPGWFDVVENALADEGYYLAPIVQPQTVGSRASDPQTSHDAVPSRMRAGSQRHLLLETFGRWPDDGLTDEQAMYRTNGVSSHSEYATRCSELRAAGLIKDTGRTRESDTGKDRIVSEITEMGEAELRRLGASS